MAAAARLHKDAVLAALRALSNPPGVYDAEVPATPAEGGHIVVYPGAGDRAAPTMNLDYRRVTTNHQLTCVGASPDEALWAADRGCELLGQVLTVTGRSCEPVRFLGSSPAARDDTTRDGNGRPLFSAVIDIAVTSQPS